MILYIHRSILKYFVLLLFLLLTFAPARFIIPESAIAQEKEAPVLENYDFEQLINTEARERIENALPGKASVAPLRKRKLLIVNLNVRDGRQMKRGHASIPLGNYAIKRMGEKTGAYEAVFSNDTLIFQPEYLAQFDAICFNNTVGVLFGDPGTRKGLLEFIYCGK